jgi:hypothetical protein
LKKRTKDKSEVAPPPKKMDPEKTSHNSCEGMIPNPHEKKKSTWIATNRTYCLIATRSNYQWGYIGASQTLFSKDCTGKGKRRVDFKIQGILCDECLVLHQKSWHSSIAKLLKRNHEKYQAAVDALNLPAFTESTVCALKQVLSTADAFLSEMGQTLKAMCLAHVRFYQSSTKLWIANIPLSSSVPAGTKAGPKGFREQFGHLYQNNKEV